MRCATRRMTLNLAPHAVAVVALVLVASFASAQADLAVTATWDPNCDPCTAGQRLTIVNTVTNQGPDPDPSVHIQMATPALGTTPVEDSWTTTQGEYDADDEGNILLRRRQRPGLPAAGQMGVMTPGSTATLTYEVDLDMEAPPVSDVTVNSPADLAGPWEHRAAARSASPSTSGTPPPTWSGSTTARPGPRGLPGVCRASPPATSR